MKKLFNHLTGFHNIPSLGDISKPMVINTVNPEYLDIPKDERFIKEISESRKQLEGILSSTDIIKDTFKPILQ